MFTEIIKNGIFNGKTNEQIIADIESECKNHFSGSTVEFMVEDIEWFRNFINPKVEVK